MKPLMQWFGSAGVFVLAFSFALAACGGGDEQAEDAVHTILDEWSITAEHDAETASVVSAGQVTFEVHNDGRTPHELALIKTDLPVASLPMNDSAVDEEAAGTLLGRTVEMDSDELELLTLDLQPGAYALICNITGHYERGMYALFIVE